MQLMHSTELVSVGTTGHNAVPGQLSKHFLYNKMPNEIERVRGGLVYRAYFQFIEIFFFI